MSHNNHAGIKARVLLFQLAKYEKDEKEKEAKKRRRLELAQQNISSHVSSKIPLSIVDEVNSIPSQYPPNPLKNMDSLDILLSKATGNNKSKRITRRRMRKRRKTYRKKRKNL